MKLATVRGYLFAIVRNLFLQELDRRRRGVPFSDRFAAHQPGPEDRAAAQSALRAVLAALATLADADRAAVLMRADDRLPYEEIARALGISATAAKVKVHGARLKLAEALEQAAPRE